MTTIIRCPTCQKELSIETEWAGQQVTCPLCHNDLIIPNFSNSQTTTCSAPSSMKMPIALKVAIGWLYALVALGAFLAFTSGEMSGSSNQGLVRVFGFVLIVLGAGINAIRKGNNLARIAATVACGLAMFGSLSDYEDVDDIVDVILVLVPTILLWQPQCNEWFHVQKQLKAQ